MTHNDDRLIIVITNAKASVHLLKKALLTVNAKHIISQNNAESLKCLM